MSNTKVAISLPGENQDFSKVVREVSALVGKMAGIQLGEKQFTMVENRVRSRMIRLGLDNPNDYIDRLKNKWAEESQILLSLITTHHTYFFREFAHFEFLKNTGINKILSEVKKRGDKKIRIWSAACSRGQEVYSLSMFLTAILPAIAPGIEFEIWGTDVDPESVKIANNGVYPYKDIKQIPMALAANHWARGSGEISEYVKAKPSIKSQCHFETFNLIQPSNKFSTMKFDIIFCRNVFIYFSPDQIQSISQFFMKQLTDTGLLFLGISESLNGLDVDAKPVGPSIYVKKSTALKVVEPISSTVKDAVTTSTPKQTSISIDTVAKTENKPIRVICVDDSPSILTLLKRILDKAYGFEIVATAANGKIAMELMKTTKADLMTLDIHMPEMDGITYLKQNMNANHPPIVMISSVNRENADTALKALELGASDYIEKPSLQNLAERSDEIRTKLKSAVLYSTSKKGPSEVDLSFKKSSIISNPENKLRILIGGLTHKKVIDTIVSQMKPSDPHLLILVEGAKDALDVYANELKKKTALKINVCADNLISKSGEIFIYDLKSIPSSIEGAIKQKKCAAMILGLPSGNAVNFFNKNINIYWILEDLPETNEKNYIEIKDKSSFIAPATSFMSISEENLD
ncbi:MAG: CheR family methyltransferase [Pseudobdellovibrionaceae bacterium]